MPRNDGLLFSFCEKLRLAQAQQFMQMLQAGGFPDRRREWCWCAKKMRQATPSRQFQAARHLPLRRRVELISAPQNSFAVLWVTLDCSTNPAATLTIMSGSQVLKMQIAHRNRLALIGADQFPARGPAKRWQSTTARETRAKHR